MTRIRRDNRQEPEVRILTDERESSREWVIVEDRSEIENRTHINRGEVRLIIERLLLPSRWRDDSSTQQRHVDLRPREVVALRDALNAVIEHNAHIEWDED